MSDDKYVSFNQLFAHERPGIDYRIVFEDRGSDVLIMAPHGGRIEPGTSEIAFEIARGDMSLYCFEGLRKRPHSDLHITSHKYDDPQALDATENCELVVAIHGRKDRDDPETIWLGGLDKPALEKIRVRLKIFGFRAEVTSGDIGGTDPNNICNRGRTGRGVQLELPISLRNKLMSNPAHLTSLSDALRNSLTDEPG